jgi:CBS-domain-containing membrane protein
VQMASGRTSRLTRAVGLALARRALRRCLAGPGAAATLVAVAGASSAELVEGEQR